MKNKAFTLLELLGVIIILGILSLITFPIILNQIKNAKQGIKYSTKTLIIDAAKDYYEDNTNNFDLIEGITYCIDIKTLTDNNYLNEHLKDEDLNNIDTSKKVKLIYRNNKLDYDVTDTCINNSLARNNIEVPIVTENSGLYKSTTDEGRYIYRGETPDNWIELNEGTEQNPNYVKYRIISYEPDGTMKVARNERLEDTLLFWDKSHNRSTTTDTYCQKPDSDGCNVWGNQYNTLFKGNPIGDNFHYSYYSNNTTTELTDTISGTVTSDSTLNTYLNDTWLENKKISEYIENHSFNVGGIFYIKSYSGGDKGIKKEKEEESRYTWNGKVGLLNVTEILESSLNLNCTSVYSNYYYNKSYYYKAEGESNASLHISNDEWPCKTDNYNYKENYVQWTLSPHLEQTGTIWTMMQTGSFGFYLSINAYMSGNIGERGVRPAFYLKSNIGLTGSGTETNPYRIVGES